MTRLSRSFFARDTLDVARDLLGARLVFQDGDHLLSGFVTETEAYVGEEDQACHARAGRTKRTRVMYGAPGHAYIYLSYGIHWLLNAVTETEGFPSAVLIRAVQPDEGISLMRNRRQKPDPILTDGPAKLTQAFGIDVALNEHDFCRPAEERDLFFAEGVEVPEEEILTTPRIGLGKTPEPWKSIPWRFKVEDL